MASSQRKNFEFVWQDQPWFDSPNETRGDLGTPRFEDVLAWGKLARMPRRLGLYCSRADMEVLAMTKWDRGGEFEMKLIAIFRWLNARGRGCTENGRRGNFFGLLLNVR